MVRDIFFTIIAAVWLFISFKTGNTAQAIVWFSVLFYAATNATESRLRD